VLERIVRMRMQAVFVLDDLAIEFVRHGVDRGVQVRIVALDEDVLAGNMTADFAVRARRSTVRITLTSMT